MPTHQSQKLLENAHAHDELPPDLLMEPHCYCGMDWCIKGKVQTVSHLYSHKTPVKSLGTD